MEKERLELIRRVIADGFHMAKRDDAFVYCEELAAEVERLTLEVRLQKEGTQYKHGETCSLYLNERLLRQREADRLQAKVERLRAVLTKIAETDDIAGRLAREALAADRQESEDA